MKKTDNLQEQKSSELEDMEIQEIFQRANQEPGDMLLISDEGDIKSENELQRFVLQDTDDPAKKHSVYYDGIEKLLRMYPKPSSKAGKEAMKILREEKNIFLTRGKKKDLNGRRGADVRMAYIPDMQIALDIISYNFINEGKNIWSLYQAFRNKNVELGYQTPEA